MVGIKPEWLGGDEGQGSRIDLNRRARANTPVGKALRKAREYYQEEYALAEDPHQRTPRYELIAQQLEREILRAWGIGPRRRRQRSIQNLVSLTFWRQWIFDDHLGGVIAPEDMEEFAAAMRSVLLIALKPWLEQNTRPARIKELFGALEGMDEEIQRMTRLAASRASQAGATLSKGSPSVEEMGKQLDATPSLAKEFFRGELNRRVSRQAALRLLLDHEQSRTDPQPDWEFVTHLLLEQQLLEEHLIEQHLLEGRLARATSGRRPVKGRSVFGPGVLLGG